MAIRVPAGVSGAQLAADQKAIAQLEVKEQKAALVAYQQAQAAAAKKAKDKTYQARINRDAALMQPALAGNVPGLNGKMPRIITQNGQLTFANPFKTNAQGEQVINPANVVDGTTPAYKAQLAKMDNQIAFLSGNSTADVVAIDNAALHDMANAPGVVASQVNAASLGFSQSVAHNVLPEDTLTITKDNPTITQAAAAYLAKEYAATGHKPTPQDIANYVTQVLAAKPNANVDPTAMSVGTTFHAPPLHVPAPALFTLPTTPSPEFARLHGHTMT
jgi:hypothetical protein